MQDLFHEAADLEPAERRPFLESACYGDEALIQDVLAMLSEDASASFLDRGLPSIASDLLDEARPEFERLPSFGPYRLRKVLGEGGMGIVYLADREDVGSQVAIKVLRDAWLSPARRERFTSEQRWLAQLEHPSIARLYDASTLDDGTPWFVMEYVEGIPITTYCRERNLTIEERLRLFRAVADAVQFAHEHAIIHRDLKPSNILAKPDGTVRLLDFGIAKQLEHFDQPADQTQTQLRLMTPAYAAPEQIRGGPVGVQTDVYSLGLILYELVADRPPFDFQNCTPVETALIITEQQPSKPAADCPGIGKAIKTDLDVLCLTAMHKDSARRYRSVEALIRDIDHFLNNEPLEARPDSWSYRVGKFYRRNRRPVLASAAVIAAMIAVIVFFTVHLTQARYVAESAALRSQRVQAFMTNLFEGGDKEAGPSEGLRVITLLDRGVAEAKLLNREPQVQADLYQTLGSLYRRLGNFKQADWLSQAALDQRRKMTPKPDRDIAGSLVALGLLRADEVKLDEAEKFARQGLATARSIQPRDDQSIAKALAGLGKVLQVRGRYPEAIPELEQAVKLYSKSGEVTAELALSTKDLAETHYYAGHYETCETLFQRVLQMHEKLFGDRHPRIADDLVNLGAVRVERGDNASAEQHYRRAIAIDQAWYGPDHPETAGIRTMLGRLLVGDQRTERVNEGKALLESSLKIRERVYGKVHPKVAVIINELARIALERGRFDEAEAGFLRTMNIYRAVYNDRHYLLGVGASNLATVYFRRKEYARAEASMREAIRRYEETLAGDHQMCGLGHIKLGDLLLRRKRYSEALTETMAGYRIYSKDPQSLSSSWAKLARQNLGAEYEALGQPEEAAKYRN